jgi:hypothetical protein
MDPERTYQVIAHVELLGNKDITREDRKRMELSLEFDLDNLKSIHRHWTVRKGSRKLEEEISTGERTRVWGESQGHGSWSLRDTKDWDQSHEEAISEDPRVLGIRIEGSKIYPA